jgi:hypothetical protein
MPLKDRDRTRPRRLVRLGIVRLGHKEKKTKERKDGTTYEVEYPVADDHFVLTDAPEVAAFYGEEPRELNVILPFPDIARNFDAWYTVWAGGVLICKGDGEQVQYAAPYRVEEKRGRTRVYNAPGDTLVSDGQAQIAFDWNGQRFEPGDIVPCPGAAQSLYPHCTTCRISAILKVMMADPKLFRLGYYQVATGSKRNYDTLLGTLELVSGNGQRPVSGIPFKLRLVEEAITYTDGGQRKATNKWFLQLEPDPDLTRRLYQQQAAALVGDMPPALTATVDATTGEIMDEIVADDEAPPPFAEQGGPAEEPEPEGSVDAAIDTAKEDKPIGRPASPDTVVYWLRKKAEWVRGEAGDFSDARRQPDDEQEPPPEKLVQRVAALMGKALAGDDDGRHAILGYVFGVGSTKLLTLREAEALAKWLEAATMSYMPSGVAAEECRQLLRVSLKALGQQELPLETE